jgi:hypothetical protein
LGFWVCRVLRRFRLTLATQVLEPNAPTGEAGAVLLWVRTVDDDPLPRAFAVPYSKNLHRKIAALESGQSHLQRMYGRGDGAGGVELYLRAQLPPPKQGD